MHLTQFTLDSLRKIWSWRVNWSRMIGNCCSFSWSWRNCSRNMMDVKETWIPLSGYCNWGSSWRLEKKRLRGWMMNSPSKSKNTILFMKQWRRRSSNWRSTRRWIFTIWSKGYRLRSWSCVRSERETKSSSESRENNSNLDQGVRWWGDLTPIHASTTDSSSLDL